MLKGNMELEIECPCRVCFHYTCILFGLKTSAILKHSWINLNWSCRYSSVYSQRGPAGPREQPPRPAAAPKSRRWRLPTHCWLHTDRERVITKHSKRKVTFTSSIQLVLVFILYKTYKVSPKVPHAVFILTKVLGGGAVVTENCDYAGPEDLQGGDVGGEDAERPRERGYVHLFDTGLFEKHLRREDENTHPSTHNGKRARVLP